MKLTTRSRLLSFVIALLLSCTNTVRADGDIGFLTSASTIMAGQPFSWLELGRDMPAGSTPTVPVGTATFPNPTQSQVVNVTTSRGTVGANNVLILVFRIPDNTRQRASSLDCTGITGTQQDLCVGDKIIIEIDPDNSGHEGGAGANDLSVGTRGTDASDYRFEIVLNNLFPDTETSPSPIDRTKTGYRFPTNATTWGPRTNDRTTPFRNGVTLATAQISGAEYIVTVNISLDEIGLGSAASDHQLGISFAVINDLAFKITALNKDALTATTFPSSMGLSTTSNQVGVLDNDPATETISGSWVTPSQWATGFFSSASTSSGNDVQFVHSPNYYISSDLRLGICTTMAFDDVGAVVDWTTNQTTLTRWYQYYPGTLPCSMRVWFKVHRTGSGTPIRKRFLIVWAQPNAGGDLDWTVVSLTPTLVISAPAETFNVLWNTVPANSFSHGHPCLRIYALPETLNRTSADSTLIDDTFVNGINTSAELQKLHEAYTINPPDTSPFSAQMNFSALQTDTTCMTPGCPHAGIPARDRDQLPASGSDAVRIINAGYSVPSAEAVNADAQAQNPDNDKIRIFIEGFGVDGGNSSQSYVYVKPLGGAVTMISNAALQKMEQLTIEVAVGNPQVERLNVTQNGVTNVISPPRKIFLGVTIATPPGVPPPTYTIHLDRTDLQPGETTKGTVVVRPVTSTPPGFKRWGLSLHAGVSIPHGNFNNVFNPGPNLGFDLEYRVNPKFSIEGIYTFHRFNGEDFDFVTVPDLNLHQFSINGKVYGSSAPVRPFFNFGGGVYKFDPGDTRGGLNIGGGFQWDFKPNVAFDVMYNYHNVFTPGAQTRFSTVQGGVRFRF